MSEDYFNYMIGRLIECADEAVKDAAAKPEDRFLDGVKLAYYMVLDSIKNDLDTIDYDLSSCGLDIDLDKVYL